MSDEWYYAKDGQRFGPMSLARLRDLLPAADWKQQLVWRPGLDDWVTAGSLPEFLATPPPVPLAPPDNALPRQQLPQEPSRWRKRLIGVFSFIFVVIAASFGGTIGREVFRYFNTPSKETLEASLNKGLNEGLKQIKTTLPNKVDDSTTMIDASVEGLVTSYFYVIDETRLNITTSFAADARKLVAEKVCKSKMLSSMKYGARFRYVYRNTKNQPVGSFELGIADCPSR